MNRIDKQLVKESFSRVADSYEGYADLQRNIAAKVVNEAIDFGCSGVGLDLGSGTGFINKLAMDKRMNWRLVEADIAYKMCRKSFIKSGLAVNCDIENLPFVDNIFDFCVSSFSLQWVDFSKVIKQVQRVLKSGGRLVFAMPGEGTLEELRLAFTKLDNKQHVNEFLSSEKVECDLKDAGFVEIKISHAMHNVHYDGVVNLLRTIKGVGGSTKFGLDKVEYLGKRYFDKLAKFYPVLSGNAGTNSTWNILYASAVKN